MQYNGASSDTFDNRRASFVYLSYVVDTQYDDESYHIW